MTDLRALGVVLAVAACAHTQVDAGGERGVCLAKHACHAGLICLSETCVRPPPDCAEAAAHLERLGVGAKAALADACAGRHLELAGLQCLVWAKTGAEAALCPGASDDEKQPFWEVPTCREVVVHVVKIIGQPDMERDDAALAGMIRECEKRHFSAKELRCYARSTTTDDMVRCAPGDEAEHDAAPPPERKPVDLSRLHDKIGVASCDRYVEQMMRCTKTLPAEATGPMTESMALMRDAWADAAATAEGQTALGAACVQAFNAAKQAFASMGCQFDAAPTLGEVADGVCACKDDVCAQTAMKDAPAATANEDQATVAARARMGACAKKLKARK